jgi:hypothetical protein
MSARWIIAAALSGALLGCAASTSQPRLDLSPPSTFPPASQPSGNADAVDVQQLSGQIVAGVKAELSNQIETAIETTLAAHVEATGVGRDVTGYRSEFGVGATLVVTLTLILALMLSHRREMARIRCQVPKANGTPT